MAAIAGLKDLRGHGPPADIGTFQFCATAMVFKFTFSGTEYTVAMASGVNGWTLIAQSPSGADDVEINAALNYLTAGRTWKEKVILKGDFMISSPILVDDYTVLDLNMARLYLVDGANCNIIENADPAGNRHIEITGGVLNGNKTNQPGTPNGISFTRVERSIIQECSMYSIKNNPINMLGCFNNWVLKNYLHASDSYGIYLNLIDGDVSYQNWLVENYCSNHAHNGIQIIQSSRDRLIANTCISNMHFGIDVENLSYDCQLLENLCIYNEYHGIYVELNSLRPSLVSNKCLNNEWSGITIDACDLAILIGNHCINNSVGNSDLYDGIRIWDTNESLVKGNICTDSRTPKLQRYGISEATSDWNEFEGNNVRGNLTGSLLLSGANSIATDNRGYNPQAASTPAVGASPVTFGPYFYPAYLETVGNITSVTIRGQASAKAAAAAFEGAWYLYPGDTCVIDYPGAAPTVTLWPA